MNASTRMRGARLAHVLLCIAVAFGLALSYVALPASASATTIHTISDESVVVDTDNHLVMSEDSMTLTWGSGVNGTTAAAKTTSARTMLLIPKGDVENGWTVTDVCTLVFEDAGEIGGRMIDVTIHVNKITFSAQYSSSTEGTNDDYVAIGSLYKNYLDWGSTSGQGYVYRGAYSIDQTTTVTWSDTGEEVDLPFFVAAIDLDAGSSSTYFEAWEAKSGFSGDFYTYASCQLSISGTKFTASGNTVDGDERFTLAGVYADTSGGTFRSIFYEGSCATSYYLFNQYDILDDPEKTASSDTTQVGDTLTWNVSQRIGTFYDDVMTCYTSLALIDELPSEVDYVSAVVTDGDGNDITSSAGTLAYDEGTHTVTFTFSSAWIADTANYNGQEVTLSIETVVNESAADVDEIVNSALTNVSGIELESEEVPVEVVEPVLALSKSASTEVWQEGDSIAWSVTLTQTDEDATAYNVVVSDEVPEGLTLEGTPTLSGVEGSVTVEGNTWTVSIPTLAYGEEATIEFSTFAQVGTANTTIENLACATADYANAVEASDEVRIIKPVLALAKAADAQSYQVGDTATYTLTLTQTDEEATAYQVVLRDTLPDGLELCGDVVLSGVDGTVEVEGNTITIAIDELAYGDVATVEYTATVLESAADATLLNTAVASAAYTDEVESEATIAAFAPALSISKTSSADEADAGDTVEYTVVVTQTTEGATARNVVVADALPDGLTLAGVPTLEGVEGEMSVDGNSWSAAIAELAFGEQATITFTCTIDESAAGTTISNTATASADFAETVEDTADVSVNAEEIGHLPQTGDNANVVLAALVFLSIACAVVVAVASRKVAHR